MKTNVILLILCATFSLTAQDTLSFSDTLLYHALIADGYDANQDGLITTEEVGNLSAIQLAGHDFRSIKDLVQFPALDSIYLSKNKLIDTVSLESFDRLKLISLTNNASLKTLNCHSAEQLVSITLRNNPEFNNFSYSHLPNLIELIVWANPVLEGLSISNLPELQDLILTQNEALANLTINTLPKLNFLQCSFNPAISEIDITRLGSITNIALGYNEGLEFAYLKNGNDKFITLEGNASLKYVCTDSIDIPEVLDQLGSSQNSPVVNSFCSFGTEGHNFILDGQVYHVLENAACDSNGITARFPKLLVEQISTKIDTISIDSVHITEHIDSIYHIGDANGYYQLYLPLGDFRIKTISPFADTIVAISDSLYVAVDESSTAQSANICLWVPSLFQDIAVVIIPLNSARPGDEVTYFIELLNKGTIASKPFELDFQYDSDILTLGSSDPLYDQSISNRVKWSVPGIEINESERIKISFTLNRPTDSIPANVGDILQYTSTINLEDEFLKNNAFTLFQEIVGSYDPNDKTCLEGPTIKLSEIDNYLNYLVRFENTGTAEAIKIIVSDTLDMNTFDLSSFSLVSASHPCQTIFEGNIVHFVFDNINLSHLDDENDGYVTFKIKPKKSLGENARIENKAAIYFDYNYPIITNNYVTIVETTNSIKHMPNQAPSMTIAPNPARRTFTIKSADFSFNEVLVYDINQTLIYHNQLKQATNSTRIDCMACLPNGTYIVEIRDQSSKYAAKKLLTR